MSGSVFRAFCILAGLLSSPSAALAATHHDAAGFRVDLPPGWSIGKAEPGSVILFGPDRSELVQIQALTRRTSSCEAALREKMLHNMERAGGADLRFEAAAPRTAIATYTLFGGRGRGATLCAQTSRSAGMFYSVVVPTVRFTQEWPVASAVLRSFAFEGTAGPGARPQPQMTTWREPNEFAYTLSVPVGWQTHGGIQRQDATHYTDGVQAVSPDGTSGVRLNDPRLRPCTIPGPGMAAMPGSTGGALFCNPGTEAASAADLGARYVHTTLATDFGWRDVQIDQTRARKDLERHCEAAPAMFGLQVQCSVAAIRFRAQGRGGPVAGALLAKARLDRAARGQDFIAGTLTSTAHAAWGPAQELAPLLRLMGAMVASQRVDPRWWATNNRISAEIAERTLEVLRAEAAQQQRLFWDRMAAADARREGVNDVLSGTVRLSDGQGGQYRAKAGSNYYFLEEEAARTAPSRDDAVTGVDVWPSTTVDLRPLEAIR